MRRLILGTVATAAIAIGMSSAGFAAPAFALQEHDSPNPHVANVHRVDYYWNHHHYHHRDWDRNHHHWHYYD
jgi:hypothetical protein